MLDDLPFLFGDVDVVETVLVLRIPKGMRTKDDLLSSYAEIARFPGYFGYNWDAFEELLRDLSWLEQPRILIVHKDLPLLGRERELTIYLDILRSAVSASTTNSRDLSVCFPSGVRDQIIGALRAD